MGVSTKEKANILVACMDRRLNQFIEENVNSTKAKTIVLRNAGADIDNLEGSIMEAVSLYDLQLAVVVVHNDCAAMKEISRIKTGTKSEFEEFRTMSKKYSSLVPEKLCEENKGIQLKSLEGLLSISGSAAKVKSEMVDVSKAPISEGERKIAILIDTPEKPHTNYGEIAKRIGSEVSDVYFIQYIKNDNPIPDAGIAIKAGVRDIYILSGEKTLHDAGLLLRNISTKEFASKTNIKVLEIEKSRSKVR